MLYIIIGWILLNIAVIIDSYFDGISIEVVIPALMVVNAFIIGIACILKGLFSYMI